MPFALRPWQGLNGLVQGRASACSLLSSLSRPPLLSGTGVEQHSMVVGAVSNSPALSLGHAAGRALGKLPAKGVTARAH